MVSNTDRHGFINAPGGSIHTRVGSAQPMRHVSPWSLSGLLISSEAMKFARPSCCWLS